MGNLIHSWNAYKTDDSSKPPLLFLHGFMGSGRIWLPTFDLLKDSHYCVALDLPGHGQTDADLHQLTFSTLADSISTFIDDSFTSPPGIVGYSMGGRIALYTALKYPEKFSSLILESTTAGISDSFERQKRMLRDQTVARKFLETDMKSFLEDWYSQPVFAYLADYPGLLAHIIEKKSTGDPKKLAEVIVKLSPGTQPPLWDQLSHWTKPTLIIAGSIDDKFREIGKRLHAAMPQSRLEIIDGAGHIVHLEKHKEFMSALYSFLS